MFTPEVIWGMIGGGAVVVFGAGRVVERIRNGKYVEKPWCAKNHELQDEKLQHIKDGVDKINHWIKERNGGELV